MTAEDRRKYEEYCRALELGTDATEEEIRSAYKKLCMKYHPDLHPNPDFAELFKEKMQELNAARDYLLRNYGAYSSYSAYSAPFGSFNFTFNTGKTAKAAGGAEEFSQFCAKNRGFLGKRMQLLNVIRSLYDANRTGRLNSHLRSDPELYETVRVCAYGVLMRQALEYVIKDIASVQGEDPEKATPDAVLNGMRRTRMTDESELSVYFKVKELSDGALCLSAFENHPAQEEFEKLYTTEFRVLIDGFIKNRKDKTNLAYLKSLRKALDNVSLRGKVQKTLLTGLFIRFLIECISSVICFNNRIMGLDENGREISIYEKIRRLRENSDLLGAGAEHAEMTANNLEMLRKTSAFAVHYTEHQPDISMLEEWYGMSADKEKLYCAELSRAFDACRDVLEEEYKICSGTLNPKKHHDYSTGSSYRSDQPGKTRRLKARGGFSFGAVICWIFLFPYMLAKSIMKSDVSPIVKVILFAVVWTVLTAVWVMIFISLIRWLFKMPPLWQGAVKG